jgi:hypothetical protein
VPGQSWQGLSCNLPRDGTSRTCCIFLAKPELNLPSHHCRLQQVTLSWPRLRAHTHVSHTHMSLTHTRLSHTHVSHTHMSLTHTRLSHTHTRLSHTHVSHTHTSLTHTHTSLTHTRLSHTHVSHTHTRLSHTHTCLSHTYGAESQSNETNDACDALFIHTTQPNLASTRGKNVQVAASTCLVYLQPILPADCEWCLARRRARCSSSGSPGRLRGYASHYC